MTTVLFPTWPLAGLLLFVAIACFATLQVMRGRWPLVSLLSILDSVCLAASQVYRSVGVVLWALAFALVIACLVLAGRAVA